MEAVAAPALDGEIDEGDVVRSGDEAEEASHDEHETLKPGDRHRRYDDADRQQHCRTETTDIGVITVPRDGPQQHTIEQNCQADNEHAAKKKNTDSGSCLDKRHRAFLERSRFTIK